MKFTTLHTFDTEYSADSIEWCPYEGQRTHFVCGTYQLEEKDGDGSSANTDASLQRRRKGCIYLFKYIESTNELVQLQRLNTAAILDMKWQPPTNDASLPILATANAIGVIEVYELVANELVLRKDYQLCAADTTENLLALSLDWNSNGQLLVSDSKGGITLLAYTDAGELIRLQSWSAHNFEAWICAFDKWNSAQVYSGGDDCLLRAYDLRTSKHVWSNKEHMAGVTCLLSHPRREHILLTGSYDEQLRMFDTRNQKQPLSSIALNGGIWRLKKHPIRDQCLLVACMYENFSVVNMGDASGEADAQLTLAGVYKEHSSICYGADWCQTNTRLAENISYMATCSFYDHKLCVTQIDH